MISAFKRLVNSSGEANKTGADGDAAGLTGPGGQIPSQRTGPQAGSNPTNMLNNGMHMISQSLQKKFSRGVNYNSKLFDVECGGASGFRLQASGFGRLVDLI